MTALLDVRDLETRFATDDGLVRAVDGVSFSLSPGETLGIVGESGSGKSVTVLSILRLIQEPPGKIAGGKVLFEGEDLLRFSKREIRRVRGAKISMIFQDPMTSLNPFLTIGRQLTEGMELHLGLAPAQARGRAVELLEKVSIPRAAERLGDYPHQFSGGMRQRVMIAMALACKPRILVADEPTTALDVTIQAQILDLIRRLKDETGTAVILITHALGVVAGMADRILVMYGGKVVEEGPTDRVFAAPEHPYTRALLRSVPRLDEARKETLEVIPGSPPDLTRLPAGCPFHPRCRERFEPCDRETPELRAVGAGRQVRCWLGDDSWKGRPK
ncbi:MAG: ABC transporter ATP-binding protein [Planctomycetes bacterium]|nr:ABC transporter ATP-binding protein [Planctomycetota bacterium]